MGLVTRTAVGMLRTRGIDVRRRRPGPQHEFRARAQPILERHDAQTRDDVAALAAKYEAPIFGDVRVYDLVERQALCIDAVDGQLGCVSQLTHALQVVEAMQADGIDDPDLLVAALIHDVGKLVLLVGEDPAYVGGMNGPIGEFEAGTGLDRCVLHWNHDELGYQRFKDHVPDHVAWLIRYHSMHVDQCERFMDDRDRAYTEAYHGLFASYDNGSKSMFRLPATRLEDYRDLLDEAFPAPIPF